MDKKCDAVYSTPRGDLHCQRSVGGIKHWRHEWIKPMKGGGGGVMKITWGSATGSTVVLMREATA